MLKYVRMYVCILQIYSLALEHCRSEGGLKCSNTWHIRTSTALIAENTRIVKGSIPDLVLPPVHAASGQVQHDLSLKIEVHKL